MKNNNNNTCPGDYYLGLNVGTGSVGWAVTDAEYNIKKFNGNAMWGARLFPEAQDASARRAARTGRRRLDRKQQRLNLLELMFTEEISKIDPNFFRRLRESNLHEEDKSKGIGKYSMFNETGFNDKDFMKQYPTTYHLRCELLHSSEPHDIRLVFLALHHIMKSRGHFLFAGGTNENGKSIEEAFDELNCCLNDITGVTLEVSNKAEYLHVIIRDDIGITKKKKALRALIVGQEPNDRIDLMLLSDLFSGAKVDLSKLFHDESIRESEKNSISLKEDLAVCIAALEESLGDRVEIIEKAKEVFDVVRLFRILGDHEFISEAKVSCFDENAEDLKKLKKFVRENHEDLYKNIFCTREKGLDNIPAYTAYKRASGDYKCSQEKLCKFLEKTLPDMKTAEGYEDIYKKISEKEFLTKLRSTDNGVIPQQVHRKELVRILENASTYLNFLNVVDEDGLRVKDKIISIFDFRIPYYVGPLNGASENSWVVRKADGKILPWNFKDKVDLEGSARAFVIKMTGKCTYTGENVIPKDSLLYSRFSVLNEINPIKINGEPIPVEVKQEIYNILFLQSKEKVTKKKIADFLKKKGLLSDNDELSGIDDVIKSDLKPYHDFKDILDKTSDPVMVDKIIEHIVVFGDEKKMLRQWVEKNCRGLDKNDVDRICRIKSKDWGRLSAEFLTGIRTVVKGKEKSIMDMLWETNCNLMQLLSAEYGFSTAAENYRRALVGGGQTLDDRLDSLYLAPSVRRSVRQTMRVVDEITDFEKAAPARIFIEIARGDNRDSHDAPVSRKSYLLDLYKKCGEADSEVFSRLLLEDDNSLRRDKVFLYYTQLGKCMYSGEKIDYDQMVRPDDKLYDIDHIFPKSKIKDDSLDNRVVVKAILNRDKTDIYPVDEPIRKTMLPTWEILVRSRLISEKKFTRLKRNYELTEDELSAFVARQITETQQSAKALKALLEEYYPMTEIIYSKAGNVTDFRNQFDFVKSREVNDLHYAKDAYLNIVVGNVYFTKFTDDFFRNIKNEKYSLNKIFNFDTAGAWDAKKSIVTVRKYMKKNNPIIVKMPYETRGVLFDLQLLSAGKGQLPVKSGRDVSRYGGFNKLKGAFYFIVEHTEKNKRVRTIETVLLVHKNIYESDPVGYCREILGLTDPQIIIPRVLGNTLFELNGCRVTGPTGRSGNTLVFVHGYQLTLNDDEVKYIKAITRYNKRCAAKNTELPVTDRDGITAEKNLEIWKMFMTRCTARVYANCFGEFGKLYDEMVNGEETFKKMTPWGQVKVLLEILKSFQSNTTYSSTKEIGGIGTRGRLDVNKKISSLSSAFLIHQSVTGLVEERIDLLAQEIY